LRSFFILEAWVVYLFESGDACRYAFSIDKTGCNMPPDDAGWLLRGELEPEELPQDFAPAVEHLVKFGFSILRIDDED
jgi:hypothetical protein